MGETDAQIVVMTHGESDTAALGKALGALGAPLVIALNGPLGAGKTAFVRGLVHGLPGGETLRVQSPTFALARTYATTPPVHHLDLYRLDDEQTCIELGLEEMVRDTGGIACVEWADQAPGILEGAHGLRIEFPETAEEDRELVVRGPPSIISLVRAHINR